MKIQEKFAGLIVFSVIISIPLCAFLYQYVYIPSIYSHGERVFNITAVGEPSGAYTLEEINGLNYWWKRFSPMTLQLNVGDSVTLNLRSADATHQFYVPELNLAQVTITPGKVARISFKAEKEGIFQYFCTTMCGNCHTFMTGWIVISSKNTPIEPPNPIVCPLCVPDFGRPPQTEMADLGEYLYQQLGCVGCHGWLGKGRIRNPNYAKTYVPAHNTTSEKLFLRSREDAESLTRLITANEDIRQLDAAPDIAMFNIVCARYQALKDIAKNGSTPEKMDKSGPEPPLWMPAWKDRLTDRELDAIILYFISLTDWDDNQDDDDDDEMNLFTRRFQKAEGTKINLG